MRSQPSSKAILVFVLLSDQRTVKIEFRAVYWEENAALGCLCVCGRDKKWKFQEVKRVSTNERKVGRYGIVQG